MGITKLTGFGAGLTDIGPRVGYKLRAYSSGVPTYTNPTYKRRLWWQYIVTAVGYRGVRDNPTIRKAHQMSNEITPQTRAVITVLEELVKPNYRVKAPVDIALVTRVRNMRTDFVLSGNDDYAHTLEQVLQALGSQA
jgi:hypothetical protein